MRFITAPPGFFVGLTALPSNATMCDARAATEAAASSLLGPGSQQAESTREAWIAVGLTDTVCGLATPTPTPARTPTPTPSPVPTPTPTPTDSDDDGVPDASDNCPAWPNADQSLPPWEIPVGDDYNTYLSQSL